MTRDFEAHVYFEHQPLTRAAVDALLARLAAEGLSPDDEQRGRYPALAALTSVGGASRLAGADLEDLLRSRAPPVGSGYGILPFRITRTGLPAGYMVFLSFGRPDTATGLDSVSLIMDGHLFDRHEARALDAAFEWFVALCAACAAVYGWADWETATFLEAAPTRRDIRAGRIPRLMRFNAAGPALRVVLDDPPLGGGSGRVRELEGGAAVFERAPAES